MMTVDEKITEIEERIRRDARVLTVLPLDGHRQYLKEVCENISLAGLHCEFGVARGGTLNLIASYIGNEQLIYGFDWFEGLPEEWDSNNPKGVFNLDGQVPPGPFVHSEQHDPGMFTSLMHAKIKDWSSNVRIVKGKVEDTVPRFLKQFEGDLAFAHLDLDLYTGTRSVLKDMVSRIKEGTILAFDELLDYPTYREHEIKAFAEFLLAEGSHLDFEPLIYHKNGYEYQQVTVKIVKGK